MELTGTVILAVIIIVVFLLVRSAKTGLSKSSDKRAKSEKRMPANSVPGCFRKGIRGTARGVEKREVSNGGVGKEDYLAFRLEIVDNEGNVREFVPTEARAKEISGKIMEGDTLIVIGRRNRQGLLKPKSIYNVTTNSTTKVKEYGFFDTTLGCFLGLIFTCSVFGLIAGGVMTFAGEAGGVVILAGSALAMIISIYITRKRRMG